jgi:multimeric flavodoxin WrbA
MKVVTILGSPKKHGKTDAALQALEKEIVSRGGEVERVHIADYNINGCLGCFACMANPNEPGCVQKDDAPLIFEKMASADAVVVASPIYCFFLSAQIKPFTDRCFCLSNTPTLDGKRMALLTICGGPSEGNADLAQEFFRRAFDGEHGGFFHHTKLVGTYSVPQSNDPDFPQRANVIAEKMADELLN